MGLLAAACLAAYGNSLQGAFLLDDRFSIVANESIRSLWNLPAVLLPASNSSVAGRPLANLAFALNYAFGALDPRGYHLVNLAIHLKAAVLAFFLVRETLQSPALRQKWGVQSSGLALAVALLWAVHPLNSEVVDYLTQRTESMMACCYLFTLYAAARSLRAPGWRWTAAAVAACAAGMACKESMVTAPLAVVLYDALFGFDSAGQAWRARWRFYLGLAATWLLLAALNWNSPRADSAGFSTGVAPWTYLLNQAAIVIHYLALGVWPRRLVALYGWPLPLQVSDVWPQALAIVALLLLTAAGLWRRSRLACLGAWFFLTLAPTSSIVPIATEVGAERRMYLPLLAITALVVVGVATALQRLRPAPEPLPDRPPQGVARVAGAALLAAVSIALAAGTVARNRDYQSGLTLARTIVERRPTGLAHEVLGEELMAAGDHEAAVRELREAVASNSRAGFSLGAELFAQGRTDDATAALDAFVRTSGLPYRLVPHWQEPSPNELLAAHELLGRAFAAKQQWPMAVEHFRQALAVAPGDLDAQRLLADAFYSATDFDDAIARYRPYVDARPADAEALANLGISLARTGKTDEAIAVFRRVVQIDPGNAAAHMNLATALRDLGDVAAASLEFDRANRIRADGAGANR